MEDRSQHGKKVPQCKKTEWCFGASGTSSIRKYFFGGGIEELFKKDVR
jgi:hypothetical protein